MMNLNGRVFRSCSCINGLNPQFKSSLFNFFFTYHVTLEGNHTNRNNYDQVNDEFLAIFPLTQFSSSFSFCFNFYFLFFFPFCYHLSLDISTTVHTDRRQPDAFFFRDSHNLWYGKKVQV